MMTNQELILGVMRAQGKADALDLRARAPALWSIRHTKDPKRAKPWLAPNGTSGLYELDECATENGHVYQNGHDNNEFSPSALPERWTDLGTIEEVQGA